jgi:hypothetical protein
MKQILAVLAITLMHLCAARAEDTNVIQGVWTGEPTTGQLGLSITTYEFGTNSLFTRSIENLTIAALAAMRNPSVKFPASQMTGKYWVETNKLFFVFQGYEWMTNVATFMVQEKTLVLTQGVTTNRFKRKEKTEDTEPEN